MALMKHFTRGGQVLIHNIRMLSQIGHWFLIVACLLCLLLTGFVLFLKDPFLWRTLTLFAIICYAKLVAWINPAGLVEFSLGAKHFIYPARDLINASMASGREALFFQHLLDAFAVSGSVTAAFVVIGGVLLGSKGAKQAQGKYIRGAKLASSKAVNALLKKEKVCGSYTLASVHLPKGSECQHILITGSTGAGKSVAIKGLMQQIRAHGDKAIVFDKGCSLLPYFFEEGDILLNPLDDRGARWDVWSECQSDPDFEMLGEALIPHPARSQSDPYFIHAARNLFIDVVRAHHHAGLHDMQGLLEELFAADLAPLAARLKGTPSEALVCGEVEKTALNVKSELANHLKCLRYLLSDRIGVPIFSIRQWIAEPSPHWLFMTSTGTTHDLLKPLISTWINIACQALLSRKTEPEQKLFILLDELASLHYLPGLLNVIAEGRKFGVSIVIGLQSIGQLEAVYGMGNMDTITSNLVTKLFLRAANEKSAEWISKNIGSYEYEASQESVSYGAHLMRDGMSVSRYVRERRLVLPSQIMALKDLAGYLRIKGDHPVVEVSFAPETLLTKAVPFERKVDDLDNKPFTLPLLQDLCDLELDDRIDYL